MCLRVLLILYLVQKIINESNMLKPNHQTALVVIEASQALTLVCVHILINLSKHTNKVQLIFHETLMDLI